MVLGHQVWHRRADDLQHGSIEFCMTIFASIFFFRNAETAYKFKCIWISLRAAVAHFV
jgi:hypothetical protein